VSRFPFRPIKDQYQVLLPAASGDIILSKWSSLYAAAGWLWLHVRRCYLPAIKSSDIAHCILDTETGERWSFSELLAGHFMDDVLPLEILSQGRDAQTEHEPSIAWESSTLVKSKYRRKVRA
jgi:hypothetical protein